MPAKIAAKVQENVETAIHDAGFPGFFRPGTLTVASLTRIGAVLKQCPGDWFPAGCATPEGRREPSPRRHA